VQVQVQCKSSASASPVQVQRKSSASPVQVQYMFGELKMSYAPSTKLILVPTAGLEHV
jgi:hypothetical protein